MPAPRTTRTLCALLTVAAAFGRAAAARAEEGWLLDAELAGAIPIGEPQTKRFGLGISPAVSALRPLDPHLLAGVRLRGGLLIGKRPADPTRKKADFGGLGG